MNRQHSSQQKFFDLSGELKFRAIFHFAMGVIIIIIRRAVMYHDSFSFRNERMYAHSSFLSVGLPADFLDWLGYQLIFFICWDCPFLPVGIPADFLDWLGYQLIFLIGWATS
jgi:hypothetical protein